MTEYWVSQPKHWCEYCRCWVQNNPGSILRHEQGTRHKEQVELKLAQIRKNEREKVKVQERAATELDKIERLAQEQYRQDVEQQQASENEWKLRGEAPPHDTTSNATWTFDPSSGYHYDRSGLYYDRKRNLYYFSQTRQWYASLSDARAHAPLPQAAPAAPQQQQQQRAAAQQQPQLVPKSRVESTAGKGGPVKIGSTKISKHGSKDPYMKSVKQKDGNTKEQSEFERRREAARARVSARTGEFYGGMKQFAKR